MAQRAIALFLELTSKIRIFLPTFPPRTKSGSNSLPEGNSKWRVCDEVGAVIKKVTNDGWLPNLQYVDEWD